MKNILSLRFARLQSLRNVFVLIALCGLIAYSITGCSSGPTSPGAGIGTQTTTIYGRIIDESGVSLMGVSVSAGAKMATTDANGIFILKDATVPQGRAVVIAKKAGYFNAAHAEVPNSNGTTRMALSMMSDAATANVSATNGGTVNVTGGASIAFSAGSFTDASGTPYSGTVSVAARFLDPQSASFFDYFSGDDLAQTTSGKSVSLISSGVLRVELKDQSGNTLKLDASKPATLSYPKPIDTKAPAVMPLWYFDETLGMWKEEGSATLKNGIYSGTVTHFSEHNLDYFDSSSSGGFSHSTVLLRVVCNGIPIGGVAVSIVADDAPGKYFVHPGGITGPDGRITFIRFPDNRPTQIDISSAKNNGLYFINTPINVTVTNDQTLDLGDVSLNSPCPASISGSLECNGTKVEGLLTVSDGKNITYAYTKTGDFGMQVPSTVPLTVDATNANGDVANTTIVTALASGEQRNIGNIGLCGSGTPNYTEITVGTSSAIALSPDGSRLAVWGGSILTVYDASKGNLLSSATSTPTFNTLQFSLDGSKLLAAENNYSVGQATVYDVSGTIATVITTIPNIINAKLYDDGSKIIASLSSASSTIVIYSAVNGSLINTLTPTMTGKNNYYSNFGFIRGENAAIYQDGLTARVWGVATNAELRNFPVTGASYYFASSEDGNTVATGGGSLPLSCFDTKAGAKIGDLTGITNSSRDSGAGTLILTQNYVYTSSPISGAVEVSIIKISDGTSSVRLLSASASIDGLAASRNEKYLAAAQNGKVRIWKLQ